MANAARVLLIEDNRDAADALSMLLELDGHDVRVAYDGAHGLEQTHAWQPDLVVCDIGLPGQLDGYEVARRLRADPATAGLHLVALSGYGRPEDLDRSREAGFDDHLVKPCDPDALSALADRGRRITS